MLSTDASGWAAREGRPQKDGHEVRASGSKESVSLWSSPGWGGSAPQRGRGRGQERAGGWGIRRSKQTHSEAARREDGG